MLGAMVGLALSITPGRDLEILCDVIWWKSFLSHSVHLYRNDTIHLTTRESLTQIYLPICRSSSLDHPISYVHSPAYKAHPFPMQPPLQFYFHLHSGSFLQCLRPTLLHVSSSPPPKKRSNLRDSRYQLSVQCHGQSRSVLGSAMVYPSPLLLTYCITSQRVLRSLQSLKTRSP